MTVASGPIAERCKPVGLISFLLFLPSIDMQVPHAKSEKQGPSR